MKKMLFILPIVFLIAGCTIQDSKISDDQIFQKKQECVKYKNEIEKEIKDRVYKINNSGNYYSQEEFLEEIFYSPVKNSCLYSSYVIQHNMFNNNITCGSYEIYDILTKEKIGNYLELLSDPVNNGCDTTKSDQKYKEALEELKGE